MPPKKSIPLFQFTLNLLKAINRIYPVTLIRKCLYFQSQYRLTYLEWMLSSKSCTIILIIINTNFLYTRATGSLKGKITAFKTNQQEMFMEEFQFLVSKTSEIYNSNRSLGSNYVTLQAKCAIPHSWHEAAWCRSGRVF